MGRRRRRRRRRQPPLRCVLTPPPSAWLGGEFGGAAIADVVRPLVKLTLTLTADGQVQPLGPAHKYGGGGEVEAAATFYPASYVNDSNFLDMSFRAGVGRTYRFHRGAVVRPFGFGLSYSNFSTVAAPVVASMSAQELAAGARVVVKVNLTNEGPMDGDWAVLAFVRALDVADAPLRRLCAFEKARGVRAGATVGLELSIGGGGFETVREDGTRVIAPGRYEFDVEGGVFLVEVGGVEATTLALF